MDPDPGVKNLIVFFIVLKNCLKDKKNIKNTKKMKRQKNTMKKVLKKNVKSKNIKKLLKSTQGRIRFIEKNPKKALAFFVII